MRIDEVRVQMLYKTPTELIAYFNYDMMCNYLSINLSKLISWANIVLI